MYISISLSLYIYIYIYEARGRPASLGEEAWGGGQRLRGARPRATSREGAPLPRAAIDSMIITIMMIHNIIIIIVISIIIIIIMFIIIIITGALRAPARGPEQI